MTLLEKVITLGFAEKIASSLIKQGKVSVNSQIETLINYHVKNDDLIMVHDKSSEYVSRGAYKLLGAIDAFGLDFKDKVVLDIGASTGGFTDVALKHGATKVFAVDVGTNQLAYKLRQDSRVQAMEKTNLKTLKPEMFDQVIDIVVCDVSFISLKRVFDVLAALIKKNTQLMGLIKPQFEAPSNLVLSKGIVAKEHHHSIIEKITEYAKAKKFKLESIAQSPLTGKTSKNIEYLSLFTKE